jgi:hypothetical protein
MFAILYARVGGCCKENSTSKKILVAGPAAANVPVIP